MKRKIICIGIIGLFLITGIAFPALGKIVEKDTETQVAKLDEDLADIVIKGFFRINVKIIPDKEIQNSNYKYKIRIQFNEENAFLEDGFIKSSTIRFHFEPLFYLRIWGLLQSRQGTVKVSVDIMRPVGGGWYEKAQDTVEKTGTFGRFFISF